MSSTKIKMGSERGFGLVFAGVFAVVALLPLAQGHPLRPWALLVAAAFLGVALIRPALLAPLALDPRQLELLRAAPSRSTPAQPELVEGPAWTWLSAPQTWPLRNSVAFDGLRLSGCGRVYHGEALLTHVTAALTLPR